MLRLIAVFWLLLIAAPSRGAELLMFEERGCPWCARWHAEIGPAYPNTDEGRRAPLRRLDIHAPRPEGIALGPPLRLTPTFVLVERGREVGRITGYPGQDFFWGLLGELLARRDGKSHDGPPPPH